jgi:hypothetical protein
VLFRREGGEIECQEKSYQERGDMRSPETERLLTLVQIESEVNLFSGPEIRRPKVCYISSTLD